MKKKFDVLYSDEAIEFLDDLSEKVREKIIYNIDKASYLTDPELFKKLTDTGIWEFRTKYSRMQYRILGFWDKEDKSNTWVITSHGFVKKTNKVNSKEIRKAEKFKDLYFETKPKK